MRSSSRTALLASIVAAATPWTLTAGAQERARVQPATRPAAHMQSDAARLKNPVKPAPASIAKGKTLYATHCVSCHGTAGKGDGKMAEMMNPPKPSDFTDRNWKHGSTDGDIFLMIRDGSKGTAMRGYATRLQSEDIWNVVNYLKTLAPQASKSR